MSKQTFKKGTGRPRTCILESLQKWGKKTPNNKPKPKWSILGFSFECYLIYLILLCSSTFLNEGNHPLGIAVCTRTAQTGHSQFIFQNHFEIAAPFNFNVLSSSAERTPVKVPKSKQKNKTTTSTYFSFAHVICKLLSNAFCMLWREKTSPISLAGLLLTLQALTLEDAVVVL